MSRPRPRRLTAAFVRNIHDVGVYGDGRGGLGLAMHVRVVRRRLRRPQGLDSENHDHRHERRTSASGSYPVVGLAEARQKALENWRAAEAGADPRDAESAPRPVPRSRPS